MMRADQGGKLANKNLLSRDGRGVAASSAQIRIYEDWDYAKFNTSVKSAHFRINRWKLRMVNKGIGRAAVIGVASLLTAQNAGAHHSAAMFDEQKSISLQGTVSRFQWTNPHCWIQLLVRGQPESVEWSVEMGAPSQLFNKGWRPTTVKFGDQLTIVIHPMRDGTNGGVFVSATDATGKPLGVPSTAAQAP